jgi:hypothetical protein
MCVVSMIGDHYSDKWKDLGQFKNPLVNPIQVSRQEFDKLKAEVEEMKKLLIKAKLYDEQNNEPECEVEDKVALLKKVAELVGVSLEDVFGKQ